MTATYTRILERIAVSRTNMALAQKLFKWIVCAKRPMLLTELTEAVAFKATDKSWDKEKVLDAVRLYQAGGNLVIIDERDNTVRLAHHTVQQFLLNLPDHQSAIAAPFHFRLPEADLEAGEICVAYLSFSDFERQISTLRPQNAMPIITLPLPAAILERTTSKVGLTFGVSRLFNFAHYLRTGQFSEDTEKRMNIDFSRFAKLKVSPPQKMQEKYLFLAYAVENWISHTSNLSEHNADVWKLFKMLAINKPLPFDIRPWGDVNESNATTCRALLCWAGNADHIPLMKLVPQIFFVNDQMLLEMVLTRQTPVVEFILTKGFDIETRDKLNGRTALVRAAAEGNEALVNLLLANSADIDAIDDNGQTAWSLAAKKGHTSVIELLLANGFQINANDGKKQTGLGWAAEKGYTSIIEPLLARGADIEGEDGLDRRTPLIRAATGNHRDAVEVLLANGANLGACDHEERTALHEAAKRGYTDLVKLLLINEANIERRDRDGLTALCWAAREGHADIVELLLTKGADIGASDVYHRKPMSWAAMKGHAAVVEVLLAKGANIEGLDIADLPQEYYIFLRRPLHEAATNGHVAVVEVLLANGADFLAADGYNQTALDYATKKKHTAVVDLLLAKQNEMFFMHLRL